MIDLSSLPELSAIGCLLNRATVTYVIYRILLWIRNGLYYSLHDWFTVHLPPGPTQLYAHQIIYRKRLNHGVCRKCDFLPSLFSSAPVTENFMIRSPQWYVYTITRFEVVFVKIDKPLSKFTPFISEHLYENARLIAVMPIDRFIRVVRAELPDRTADTVLISYTPRGGSTLLSKMLNDCRQVVVSTETYALVMVSFVQQTGRWPWHDRVCDVLDAVLRHEARLTPKDKKLFIKSFGGVNALVPYIRDNFPAVKHIFLHRKNVVKCLDSIQRHFAANNNQVVNRLYRLHRAIEYFLYAYSRHNPLAFRHATPRNILEHAYLTYGVAFGMYARAPDKFALVCTFEQLTTDSAACLRSVLDVAGLAAVNKDVIDVVVAHHMNPDNDSQVGTSLSRENTRSEQARSQVLTTQDPKRRVFFEKYFQLPDGYFLRTGDSDGS